VIRSSLGLLRGEHHRTRRRGNAAFRLERDGEDLHGLAALQRRDAVGPASRGVDLEDACGPRRRVGDRDVELFTWEHADRVEELQVAAERASRTSGKAKV